ncbi:MAG: hypothetical protein RLZZ206_2372 [Cyanobacteriota bacterium]|jgi:predicted AAA+ superfamily ATPase
MPRYARVARAELGYWRTTIGEEVDVVIEAGGKLLPISSPSAPLRPWRPSASARARPRPMW